MTRVRPPRPRLRRAPAAWVGVVAAVAGVALSVWSPAAAHADGARAAAAPPGRCSPGLSLAIRGADDVLVGTVDGIDVVGNRIDRTYTLVVEVRSVHKGDVADPQVRVRTDPPRSRREARELRELAGTDLILFARDQGGDLVVRSCGGYRPATRAGVDRLQRIAPARSPQEPPAPVEFSEPFGGTPGPAAPVLQLMAPGLALVVVGGLGLFVVAVTGRRP